MGDENQRAGLSESRAVLSGGTRVLCVYYLGATIERTRDDKRLARLALIRRAEKHADCNQYACKRRALHDIN